MLRFVVLLALALSLAACDALASVVSREDSAPVAVAPDQPASAQVAYSGPEWANLELVNARTGEAFTLADLAGKAVFVEPMATWCSNCRAQQREVAKIHDQFGANAVFISLSVEAGLPNGDLATYADNNQFNWVFVVATPELTRALTAQFGRTIANPPATPHFTISPTGTVSELKTGQHSSDDLVSEVQTLIGG